MTYRTFDGTSQEEPIVDGRFSSGDRGLVDGSATQGALYFADDKNTGIYSPSNDNIAFSTAGSSRLVIDSNGKVGIGTTSPGDYHIHASNLVIYGSGDSGLSIVSGGTKDGRIMFADGKDNTEESEGTIRYDHSDDSMYFSTSDEVAVSIDQNQVTTFVGNIKMSADKGIQFSPYDEAASSPGSDSNTLDDYEEGTWTPTIVGTGATGGLNGTQSYHSSTHGSYTKIGNLVHCSFRVDFDGSTGANGSPNGSYIVLEGLPFNLAADPDNTSISTPIYYVNLGANYIMLGLQGNTSSNYAFVWAKKSATASREYLSIADVEDNSEFTGTISYRV